MNIDDLENYYFDKKLAGMDFSEIRKELHSRNMSEENIRILIRSIDDRILQEESNATLKLAGNELLVIGLFMLISGIIVTVGSLTGLINLGGYAIIAYGPIIGGIAMIGGGQFTKSRKNLRSKRFGK